MCLAPPNQQPTILVADDEEGVRSLLRTILVRNGFGVLTAVDGQDAIEVATRHAGSIDLALLDVQMPRLDGPRVIGALRQQCPELRCWLMSGHAGTYTETELLGMGAERLVTKPFSLLQLRSDLRAALSKPAP